MKGNSVMAELKYDKKTGRLLFTKQMKKEYTILMPNMAPIHFKILEKVFNYYGYKSDLLDTTGPEIAQTGLKYVHNDTCYPALLVIGQFINALQSGKYDVHKVALMITQTGGGCRASNYIFLLRKALKKAGFEFVPVISLSFGMEHNSGFSLTLPLIRRFVGGLVYGDQLMLLSNQTKPYEVNKGESMALVDEWTDKISDMLIQGKGYTLEEIDETLDRITKSFTKIELNKVPKVKVGIVGEIYVKYSKMANNGLEDFLADQDCEVAYPVLWVLHHLRLITVLRTTRCSEEAELNTNSVRCFLTTSQSLRDLWLMPLKSTALFRLTDMLTQRSL